MIFLRSLSLKPKQVKGQFPFTLPIVRHFDILPFEAAVTFFVGENGSGKSTLLEAIAAGMQAVAVGSSDLDRDHSLEHVMALADGLRFTKNRRPKRCLFFRAEDFFGFVKRIRATAADLKALEKEYDQSLTGYGRQLATGMAKGQQIALHNRYGANPDAFSHGESFINLFKSRMHRDGLYLLDEPEAPLSPQRQLAFLSILKSMVAQSCQFIIATHSPLLMAFPEARILSFDGERIHPVRYDEVEQVTLTKSFLNNPQNYLRRL